MVEHQALIWYGDGKQALFYEEGNPRLNKHDIMVIPMLVAPSIEIQTAYKLTDEDLNIQTDDMFAKKAMWVEYPEKEVRWLSRSKSGAVILIFCGFDGSRTPLMAMYKELLEFNKERDQTEALLRTRISKLSKDLEEAYLFVAELTKQKETIMKMLNTKTSDVTYDEEQIQGGM